MPKVFSKTADVARVWAAQSQDEARTGSNTSFRRDTLYSYGTPIARIVAGSNGNPIALVSSSQWSSGTSKVQGEAAHAAVEAGMQVFRVPVLGATEADCQRNVDYFEAEANAALDRVERARTPDTHRRTAERSIEQAQRLVALFGGIWEWTGRDPATVLSRAERDAA